MCFIVAVVGVSVGFVVLELYAYDVLQLFVCMLCPFLLYVVFCRFLKFCVRVFYVFVWLYCA